MQITGMIGRGQIIWWKVVTDVEELGSGVKYFMKSFFNLLNLQTDYYRLT